MQFPKHVRRLAMTGAAGLTAVALVAGCGSSSSSSSGGVLPGPSSAGASSSSGSSGSSTAPTGDSDNAHALLAASVDKVKALKNSKISLKADISAEGKDISFGGDGVIDYEGQKFQLSIELPSSLTGGQDIGSIEERLIGQTIYIKLPAAAASQLGGKTWAKVDASEITKSSGSTSPFSQDPSQILATLNDVSDSVTKVGTEDIRGVETTHYRAQIDLTKAAEKSGAEASQLEQYKELTGSDTLPEDVWLDNDGLPRRIALDIQPKSGSSASAELSKVAFTIDFFDFGKADTDSIVAPPADEVGELPTSALGGLGGS
jgi:hypothetical protein